MKKIILFTALSLVLFSCSKSQEEQAQENVKEYLSKKLDDPKSYESVSFGKLEKGKSSYKDDLKYLKLVKEEIHTDSLAKALYEDVLTYTHENTIKAGMESYKKVSAILQSDIQSVIDFEKKYKPVDIFYMKHSFRANNKMGALILDSCTVVFDKQLSVINVK